jgi:hypothetical protein
VLGTIAPRLTDTEVHEMNGRTMRLAPRSVQLAVMAAPGTTILEAIHEARRRHHPVSAWLRKMTPRTVAGATTAA